MRQPSIRINWEAPTENTDGSSIPDPSVLTYRLYEDGALAVDEIAALNFELLMDGREQRPYTYTVTAVRFGLESPQSEPAVANFTVPTAPTNVTVEWFDSSETSVSGSVG
jgi:hypothetical protein